MKKLIVTLLLVYQLALVITPSASAYAAATPSSIPSATQSSKAQDLLNRVADKIEALTKQLRRTYSGKVNSIGTKSYVITTDLGEKTVSTNDATNFFRFRGGSLSEIDFRGIKIGDDIAAVGTIDPNSSEMTAKMIIAKIHRANLVGQIKAYDNGTVTISKFDGSTAVIDLNSSLTLKKIVSGNILPARLADFTEGKTAFIIGYSPDDKTGVYSVLKATILSK